MTITLPTHSLTSYYRIAGRTLCVRACDRSSARTFARFIEGYHFTVIRHDESHAEINQTIRISSDGPARKLRGGELIYDEEDGQCYTDGGSYYLYLNDSLIIVRPPESKLIEIWMGDKGQGRDPLDLHNTLANGVQIALRRCGIYSLHAAGVVKPGSDEGALIIGESGCGKSTLTVELVGGGWRYLSDDALIISDNCGVVEARAHRRRFALMEASHYRQRLPGLAAATGAPFATNASKRWVDPTVLFPDRSAEGCVPRALFFVCLSDNLATAATRLSQSEAMQRLMQHCPPMHFDFTLAREQLRLFTQLVNQCRAYDLTTGRDILAEEGKAAALFGACMNGG